MNILLLQGASNTPPAVGSNAPISIDSATSFQELLDRKISSAPPARSNRSAPSVKEQQPSQRTNPAQRSESVSSKPAAADEKPASAVDAKDEQSANSDEAPPTGDESPVSEEAALAGAAMVTTPIVLPAEVMAPVVGEVATAANPGNVLPQTAQLAEQAGNLAQTTQAEGQLVVDATIAPTEAATPAAVEAADLPQTIPAPKVDEMVQSSPGKEQAADEMLNVTAVKTESAQAANGSQPVTQAKTSAQSSIEGADDSPTISATQTQQAYAAHQTQAAQEPARMAEARGSEVVKQVAPQLEMMAKTGTRTLTMQLNPAELGQIDLRMTAAGGTVRITIHASQAATNDLLESQLNDLRQNLANAGVQISDLNVGQQSDKPVWQQAQHRGSAGVYRQPNASSQTSLHPQPRKRALEASNIDYTV